MHRVLFALSLLSLLFVIGCKSPGLNKKLALADGAGVLATGVALDEAKDFAEAKVKTLEIARALEAFVATGALAELPLAGARAKVEKFVHEKGWGGYVGIVDTIFTYVQTADVNVDKIGKNNVQIIKTALEGVIRQAVRSRPEWATPLRE